MCVIRTFSCLRSCIIYDDCGRFLIIFKNLIFVSGLKSKVYTSSFALCESSSDDKTSANGDIMNVLGFGVIKVGETEVLSGSFDADLEFGRRGLTF